MANQLRLLRTTSIAAFLVLGTLFLAGAAPVEACTGSPSFDSRIWACGLRIEAGLSEIEWDRPPIELAEALAPDRLATVDGTGDALGALEVWVEVSPGAWEGWMRGRSVGLEILEPGKTYVFAADEPLAWAIPRAVPAPQRPVGGGPSLPAGASVFGETQVVSLYGHPGVPFMGALGEYSAEGAAAEAARVADEYDDLNGERNVIPALHLIASVAQADPGDGTYLGRMSLAGVDEYVRVTAEHGQLLFIDVQIGWGDPLAEVQRYEQQLLNPHVHVALDPEFATRSDGQAPGQSIGSLTGAQINRVQEYLAGLSASHGLPAKVLVVHQFRDDMIEDAASIASVAGVDLVIDMDGFGPQGQKLAGYDRYANASYAEFAGFKLFYNWDTPLFTPAQIQGLTPPPDYVIYQ